MVEKDTKIDDIAQELQNRINQGVYVSGQRLPSERDLTSELNASRGTVRAALLRLQAANSIDIIPRGGAIVRAANVKMIVGPINQKLPSAVELELKRAGSFILAEAAHGKQTLVRFIEPSSIIPVGDEIGARMETSPDTQVLRRYCVHLVDRVPYRILDSYYLASLFGDLLGQDEGNLPLFQWLKEHTGRRATSTFEKINARMPEAKEATLLNISRGQPVVDMDKWMWTDDNTLFGYSHIIANAALHEYTYIRDIDKNDWFSCG